MGTSRALDADGDLLYEDGKQVMLEGREAVAQGIGVCLTLIQGDDIYFPWLGVNIRLMAGRSEEDRVTSIREALARSGRVHRVLSVTRPDDPDRARRFSYIVRAIDRDDDEIVLGVSLGA